MKDMDPVARIARWHMTFALVLAVIGLALGIYMAASQNHGQHVTHAHIMLVGLVVSALYAIVYRLWLPHTGARLALAQTVLHQAGAIGMFAGLALLYGGRLPEATLAPLLGVSSVAVLLGALVMVFQFVRAGARVPAAALDAVAAPQG